MTAYKRIGRSITLHGEPFAQAVDEAAAQMIVDALEPRAPKPAVVSHHYHRQEDEYACVCGLRWAIGDADPHRITG